MYTLTTRGWALSTSHYPNISAEFLSLGGSMCPFELDCLTGTRLLTTALVVRGFVVSAQMHGILYRQYSPFLQNDTTGLATQPTRRAKKNGNMTDDCCVNSASHTGFSQDQRSRGGVRQAELLAARAGVAGATKVRSVKRAGDILATQD